MKHVKQDWRRRSAIVMGISLIVSALLWTLSLTDWAVAMNSAPPMEPHEAGDAPPAIMMIVMPFIKVTMLTVVPAAICLLIMRIVTWVKGLVKAGMHMQQ